VFAEPSVDVKSAIKKLLEGGLARKETLAWFRAGVKKDGHVRVTISTRWDPKASEIGRGRALW